jgi:hypothetical protein
MIHFKTIQTIQKVLAAQIFAHLSKEVTQWTPMSAEDAERIAANPVVDTNESLMDWLWLCVDAGSRGDYRFGYNTSSLYPSNLKCIQRMNPVSSKWELYWQEQT